MVNSIAKSINEVTDTINAKRYIFAGGGSGGHLFPGLAVADALRQLEHRAEIIFLCTQRDIDTRILTSAGFPFVIQPVNPLPALKKPRQILEFAKRWHSSIRLCHNILREKQPQAVLGLGGFASGPAMKVAAKMNLPIAMLNPDAIPGKANSFCRKYAQRIFLQWEQSRQYFGRDAYKCVVSGCPVRMGFFREEKIQAKKKLGLHPDKPTLVIVGGSQGGHNVNTAVAACLSRISPNSPLRHWQIIHISGTHDRDWVQKQYQIAGIPARVWDFTDKMDIILSAGDLAVARAGASTLAELTVAELPAILLPYPYHKDQHQMRNADILTRAGAARIVVDDCDSNSTARRLFVVLQLCLQQGQLEEMAQAAHQLAQPHAARNIAEQLSAFNADKNLNP